jgi:hypothetical protein
MCPLVRLIDVVESGTLTCSPVASPPEVAGTIGLQGFTRFITHNQDQVSPWINQVTGWNVPISSLRFGYNYQFFPQEQLVDGRQVIRV